jgi:mono/diheme cytochrome c family protein
MANSLTNDSRDNTAPRAVIAEAPVPTFDPVTPEGRRARWALLITSLVTLVCLLAAILSEHYLKPWRVYQRRYKALVAVRARAEGKRAASFKSEIKQITSAPLGVADRCTTCHLAVDDPNMAKETEPFRSHPKWVLDLHPIEKFGCTPCHGGQGLATSTDDAHGHVPHWEDMLIPAGYYEAGCGGCHTFLRVPGEESLARGARLFERKDCFACHRIDGRGRGNGPDLSEFGAKRIQADWHQKHLALQERSPDALWRESYGPLNPAEISAINAYLGGLVRAPKLIEAKAAFLSKGCLGCHRINGVGGDDGPDLSAAGRKNVAKLDFSMVRGKHDLAGWHKAHLKAPAQIVPDSQMPQPMLDDKRLNLLTLYLLSLRDETASMNRWPTDRLEALRLGEREFADDGESLFNAFCNACHGPEGFGARFGVSTQAFPAIAHPEFLAIASNRFIRQSLMDGRTGRRMPAWGAKEGGLRVREVDSLVEYLRSRMPSAPSWEEVSSATPDPALGARLYRETCAVCHGVKGEGAVGPVLSHEVFQRTVEPQFIYRMLTMGREDTAMGSQPRYDARDMVSIISYVRSWRKEAPLKLPVLPTERSIKNGEAVYARSCASCHGRQGEGGVASSVTNSALLASASDGFMASAVKLGRCVPPRLSPEDLAKGLAAPKVSDQELADAIEYLRKLGRLGSMQPPGRPARGDAATGNVLFAQACAGCHGSGGRGGSAPELANAAFLAAASDGYLEASIIRGRPSVGMPAFGNDSISYKKLTAEQAGDIVRYMRTM